MKYASDFRAIARDALRGVWTMAVIVGILASMMGGSTSAPSVEFNLDNGVGSVEVAGHTITSFGNHHNETHHGGRGFFAGIAAAGFALYAFLAAIAFAVLYFTLGSIIQAGYACFNLDLIDRRNLTYGTLFGYFPYWKTMMLARLHVAIRVFLWSLLLVIPGIIASYSYAMVPYLLAENPNLTPAEALERSKQLMEGNRMRLFCLHLSFIGWDILSVLTLGIGQLWLHPYKEAANAAFYRELCITDRYSPNGFGDDPSWTI
ncbi:MAG: DUF975 family protein [Oscillospiraceae bacterium]|nr:DUF975 family protein [Oscillospiraceae bacterium]